MNMDFQGFSNSRILLDFRKIYTNRIFKDFTPVLGVTA